MDKKVCKERVESMVAWQLVDDRGAKGLGCEEGGGERVGEDLHLLREGRGFGSGEKQDGEFTA